MDLDAEKINKIKYCPSCGNIIQRPCKYCGGDGRDKEYSTADVKDMGPCPWCKGTGIFKDKRRSPFEIKRD